MKRSIYFSQIAQTNNQKSDARSIQPKCEKEIIV